MRPSGSILTEYTVQTFQSRLAADRARSSLAAVLGVMGIVMATVSLLALPYANAQAAEPDSDAAQSGSSAQDVYALPRSDGHIQPYQAQGQVWLMAGEPREASVAVQIGNQGVLVVDTGVKDMAKDLLQQIERLDQEKGGDQKAIRYVIDTDGLPDHIGGNAVIREAGSTIVAGNFARDNPGLAGGAGVIATQNLLSRLVQENANGVADAAQPNWPTDTEDFDTYNMHFNGEAVQLFHPHNATTDGNLIVMFRRSDVVVTGDVVDLTGYPIIDTARGGTIDGELVALNHIIEMSVPEDKQEGGTLIIPGHGRVGDQSDVVHYKNVVTIIRNRIQYYKNQGKTLQQVLAIKPTWDYDQRWGHDDGPWTTRQFVEAVYKTLPARGPSFSMQNTTLVPADAAVSNGKKY